MSKTKALAVVQPTKENVIEQVGFETYRDDLVTDDERVNAGKDLLMRHPFEDGDTEKKVPVGIISKTKPILPYTDVMSVVWGGLDRSGVKWNIQESVLNLKNADVFQKYLVGAELPNPDGEKIQPLLVLKAAYTGKPLELMFGTYRLVCSNGAIAGTTVSSFSVRPKEIGSLSSELVMRSVTHSIQRLSESLTVRYAEMYKTPFGDVLENLLTERKLSPKMKREVLDDLVNQGAVHLLNGGERITKEEFIEVPIKELVQVKDSSYPVWNLYQLVTSYVSNQIPSIAAFVSASKVVSGVFGV